MTGSKYDLPVVANRLDGERNGYAWVQLPDGNLKAVAWFGNISSAPVRRKTAEHLVFDDEKSLGQKMVAMIPTARRLVWKHTRKGSYAEREEVYSAVLLSLCEASLTWDRNKASFEKYAFRKMYWGMQDYFRAIDPMSRSERKLVRAGELEGVYFDSLEEILDRRSDGEDDTGQRQSIMASDFDTLEFVESIIVSTEMLKNMAERERVIVMLRYMGYAQHEIGTIFGVSESRVCQILSSISQKSSADRMEPMPEVDRWTPPNITTKARVIGVRVFTDAETEVLRLLVQGYENREIADARKTSLETTKTQVAVILRKLGAKNRTHAGYLASKKGFV